MSSYPLFSVIGIEIEYMLVDSHNLNVKSQSDSILQALAGDELVNEVSLGEIAVSNELVMHVIELKNNGPKPPITSLIKQFQTTIEQLQPHLLQHHLQLLPTGAHPWMDPLKETQRWPHGNKEIYYQYDKIFNCKGHGWANLQSMHVNLPFSTNEEFCQLHNAIRLILPLIPALAASTPFLNGKLTGLKDSRLYFYERNQKIIPEISGEVIPEFIRTPDEYQQTILSPMYQAIAPFDPKGVLQYEWLNSRAAIPKFDSQAIEIRIIDTQECVQADIAIALAIHAILQDWQERSAYHLEHPCNTARLKYIYDQSIQFGSEVGVEDSELYRQWQLPPRSLSMREIWSYLIERVSTKLDHSIQRTLEYILSQGNLSERLLRACTSNVNASFLKQTYQHLSHCLLKNELFTPL